MLRKISFGLSVVFLFLCVTMPISFITSSANNEDFLFNACDTTDNWGFADKEAAALEGATNALAIKNFQAGANRQFWVTNGEAPALSEYDFIQFRLYIPDITKFNASVSSLYLEARPDMELTHSNDSLYFPITVKAANGFSYFKQGWNTLRLRTDFADARQAADPTTGAVPADFIMKTFRLVASGDFSADDPWYMDDIRLVSEENLPLQKESVQFIDFKNAPERGGSVVFDYDVNAMTGDKSVGAVSTTYTGAAGEGKDFWFTVPYTDIRGRTVLRFWMYVSDADAFKAGAISEISIGDNGQMSGWGVPLRTKGSDFSAVKTGWNLMTVDFSTGTSSGNFLGGTVNKTYLSHINFMRLYIIYPGENAARNGLEIRFSDFKFVNSDYETIQTDGPGRVFANADSGIGWGEAEVAPKAGATMHTAVVNRQDSTAGIVGMCQYTNTSGVMLFPGSNIHFRIYISDADAFRAMIHDISNISITGNGGINHTPPLKNFMGGSYDHLVDGWNTVSWSPPFLESYPDGFNMTTFRIIFATSQHATAWTVGSYYFDDIRVITPLELRYNEVMTQYASNTKWSELSWANLTAAKQAAAEKIAEYKLTDPTAAAHNEALAALNAAVSALRENEPPVVTKPTMTGSAELGQTLTAAATASDPDPSDTVAITYTWYKNASDSNTGGTQIGTGATLTVPGDISLVGQYIYVTATADDGVVTDAKSSDTKVVARGSYNTAPTVFAPVITGNANPGQTLTAAATVNDAEGDATTVSYTWYVADTNSVSGGTQLTTGETFSIPNDMTMVDQYIYVTAKASDGTAESAAVASDAAVKVERGSYNTAPTAQSQTLSTYEETAVDFTIEADDAEGDTLTYSIKTQPQHGVITGEAGSYTYTPDAGYSGSDSLVIMVSDATLSVDVTVSITIIKDDEPPVITVTTEPPATAKSNEPITLPDASALDGKDGSSTVTVAVYNPAGFEITLPGMTFTPLDAGTYTVIYTSTDAAGNKATVTYTIKVASDTQNTDGETEKSKTPLDPANTGDSLPADKAALFTVVSFALILFIFGKRKKNNLST